MIEEYMFVANWKMFFDFNESIDYATRNLDAIIKLSDLPNISLVLCPTFPTLYPIMKIFEKTKIKLGAQNCSAHSKGAFTGQVSIQSLKDIGCKYCIIGHSEIRAYKNETNEIIAKKFDRLTDKKISPILCIGETLQDKETNKTLDILRKQLQKVLELIKAEENKIGSLPIIIAYEPSWCVGTGVTPKINDLDSIFAWIHLQVQKYTTNANWRLFYGGSITSENIQTLRKIDKLSGFLLGKSSTNFGEFEKIIKRMYYPL